MSGLPWDERINAISVNPHMATIDDIAKMAAELGEARKKLDEFKITLIPALNQARHFGLAKIVETIIGED